MKKITKNTLETNLKQATSSLLEMAEKSCWNTISENTSYIISEIKNDQLNFAEKRIERKKINDKKNPKSLEKIASELKVIYENLYDINLHLYKSKKNESIIEIQYFPKSAHEPDFYETVKNNEPMLHSKIGIPNYRKNETDKFDVNWELGGIRHEWNNFLGKIRYYIWKNKYNRKEKLRKNNVG